MLRWGALAVVAVFLLLASAQAAPAFAWRQNSDSVALLTPDGQAVWQFNFASNQRKPYFHPVALPGNPSLSWLSPPDHVWHYGLWFAWKYLNGKNYWEYDPKTGREEGVTEWSNARVTTNADYSARLELDLVYHSADDPTPVLREHRVIEISAPATDGAYHLDWTMRFKAGDKAVEFERTPIPGQPNGVSWGGYAGLTLRFAREFKDWKAVNANNRHGLEAHGEKADGCEFNGVLDGREMGVAMLDQPQDLNAPTPWFLIMQPEAPFGCLIAAPIFHRGFTLEAGRSFTLRYRVAAHPGRWGVERLAAERARYLSAASEAPAAATRSNGSELVAPGAKVERLADGFQFTEGPTADAAGNVFFTDQPNDRIMKWSLDGRLSTFRQPAGRANGMFFDAQGNLLACADEKNELWSIAPDGQVTVLAREFRGKPLNGPNDVWARPDGGLYFTDPFYKRPWWKHDQMPQDGQHVYFLAPDHRRLARVADDLQQPNGIIGTPDGRNLYVADIRARRTYRYDIQPDGTLLDKRLFCELGSDGMTLDSQGNVYLTGQGVFVFDRTGRQIHHFEVPERWTANVCFGGADRKTLFITASKGLYAVRLQVAGSNQGK